MTCRSKMKAYVHRCVPHERLTNALEIMGEQKVDWVAVVAAHDDPRFLGWVTAQGAAVFLGTYDRRPSEVMCRELVTSPPRTLAPEQDWEEARAAIAASGYRQLPVVEEGELIGIAGLDEPA